LYHQPACGTTCATEKEAHINSKRRRRKREARDMMEDL
jgi:hypothetical protein